MHLFFLGIGIFGYLSTLQDTPQMFLLRHPLADSNDIWMNGMKIIIAIFVILNIPIKLNPCRTQMFIYVKKEHLQFQFWPRIFATFIIVFGSALVAYVFPDIYASYTLISGPMRVLITIVFPGMLGLKLMDKEGMLPRKILTILFIVITSLLGLSAAAITVLELAGVIGPEYV